jgi:hypothetical protein
MRRQIIGAAIGLALSAPAVNATVFDFSYATEEGDTLSGQVEGVLQGDGNTLTVSSVLDFALFNGAPGPSLPFVDSLDEAFGAPVALDPVLTIDGSFMDFVACTDPACLDGFGFAVGNAFAAFSGFPLYLSLGSFGEDLEVFIEDRWSLTARSQAPLPATLPLLLIGAGALAFRRRRAG